MNDNNTTILSGHVSCKTAHLTFAYPFGRSVRCLRREWIEVAEKGPSKGYYRLVTQTTHSSFNDDYTDRINRDGADAANAWAQAMVAAGGVLWNKPKTSTYHALAVVVQRPLSDGSGRIGTECDCLNLYPTPERIIAFKTKYGAHLDELAAKRLEVIEKLSRASSPQAWEQINAANAVPA